MVQVKREVRAYVEALDAYSIVPRLPANTPAPVFTAATQGLLFILTPVLLA